jgi:methionyl-tRNA formyltransferase
MSSEVPLRLVFMGTPDFAVPTLAALAAAGHEIAAVYTQKPRPAGRGQKERPSPVHQAATAAGRPVLTPDSLKGEAALAEFAALAPDAAVVVAYGMILPRAVLAVPRLGCLNLHASLLPRWRGAAPIHRAILAGDAETGVAAMQMEAGLDTGPVLLEARTPIGPRETTPSLHDRLAALGAPLMVEALAGLAAGRLVPRPQAAEGVTYAHKIDKAEGQVDWSQPAAALDRLVRALGAAPGVWFDQAGERVKLREALPVEGAGPPGTVLAIAGNGAPVVACGEGALRLDVLQRPGKGPMAAAELLRGWPLPPGTTLG